MVKLEMEVDGLPDWQTDMLNPDFAQVAEAMGMKGVTVHNPEHVSSALMQAFGARRPGSGQYHDRPECTGHASESRV